MTIRAITFDIGETLVFDRPTRDQRILASLEASGVYVEPNHFESAMTEVEMLGMQHYLLGTPPDDPEVAFMLMSKLIELLTGKSDAANAQLALLTFAGLPFERYVQTRGKELLGNLRGRGFKIGAISDWEPDLPDILDGLGILRCFDTLSVSSVVGAAKPNRALFDDAASKLAVDSREILHIGDYYELDYLGATKADMQSLLYDWRGRYPGSLPGIPIVRTFDELVSYVNALELPQ